MSSSTTALGRTEIAEPATASSRRNILLGGLIIVLAALAVYHNSFSVPFLLDDLSSVTDNPKIRHLWPIWDALSPSATSLVGGRPVVNLSFALNYTLGGLAVWGYHAFNLAIHILAGLTLFGVVRRTLSSPVLRERFGSSSLQLALAVAVLWTVHPLQTEVVTYISERCESLMGLFYLLTLYCFIRGTDSQQPGWWFTLSVMACFLGMASKEVMVTAPLMVLLYDRTFVSGSFRESWSRHRRLYLALAATWILLGYLLFGLHSRGIGYDYGITGWAYALTETRVVANYLRLAVWPRPLVFDYNVMTYNLPQVAPYALFLAILGASVLFGIWRQPALGFAGAWFFLILAPTSSVVPVAGQPMGENRMYLPLATVVTVMVLGIHRLLGRRSLAVFLALAVGLGLLTIRRNQDYRSEQTIWNDTLAKCPDSVRANYNLGNILLSEGKVQEAIDQYEHTLRLRPDCYQVHDNLGLALFKVGRVPEAIAHFEEALQVFPDDANVHYNLARALAQEGQLPAAIDHYQQALRSNPNFIEAHVNLGIALSQIGSNQEALIQFTEALRLRPDSPQVHNSLGLALLQAGKVSDAVEHFEQALRIKPDYVEAHFNLGLALEKMGRTPEAIEQYQQTLKLRPGFIPATKALARLRSTP